MLDWTDETKISGKGEYGVVYEGVCKTRAGNRSTPNRKLNRLKVAVKVGNTPTYSFH